MLASASAAVLVADGSKIGHRHLGLIGSLADFATVVTSPRGAAHLAEIPAARGTRVLAAE
jgi:DeoR/GlpR family transcriptional regulator of sugar metabolism